MLLCTTRLLFPFASFPAAHIEYVSPRTNWKNWPRSTIRIVGRNFSSPGEFDMLWAHFFATGDIAPIRQLVRALPLVAQDDFSVSVIGRAAAWSLESNCKQHDLVRAYCTWIEEHDDLAGLHRKLLHRCIHGPPKRDSAPPGPATAPTDSAPADTEMN